MVVKRILYLVVSYIGFTIINFLSYPKADAASGHQDDYALCPFDSRCDARCA